MQPQYITLPKQARDITNQRFGRLVALGPVGFGYKNSIKWHCQCDCGKTKSILLNSLTRGKTLSCGCLQKEAAIRAKTTHGFMPTGKPQFPYSTWANILTRCTNPNTEVYARYGGRGITVCDDWRNSFEAFQEYVSKLPHYGEKGYTLDRVDNNGNYEPGNVRWATASQQAHNSRPKSNTRFVTHNGQTKTLAEWAILVGLTRGTIAKRIDQGWPIEMALTKPSRKKKW